MRINDIHLTKSERRSKPAILPVEKHSSPTINPDKNRMPLNLPRWFGQKSMVPSWNGGEQILLSDERHSILKSHQTHRKGPVPQLILIKLPSNQTVSAP